MVPGGDLRQVRDETFAADAAGVDAGALLETDGLVQAVKAAPPALFPEDTLASLRAGIDLTVS